MSPLEQRSAYFNLEFQPASPEVVEAAKIAVAERNKELTDVIGLEHEIIDTSDDHQILLGTLERTRNASKKIKDFCRQIGLDHIPEEVVYYDARSGQTRNEELPSVRLGYKYKSERPYFRIAGKHRVIKPIDVLVTAEWSDVVLYSPDECDGFGRTEGFTQDGATMSLLMVILGDDFTDWNVVRISPCQKF